MSNTKDERDVYYIPPNFLTSGRLFGGMIRMRNAIEGCALVVLTGFPIINLPFSLSIRIIILCLITPASRRVRSDWALMAIPLLNLPSTG